MATPTIADYLKYANLQMAAEAFLVTEKGTLTITNGTLKTDIRQALINGNNHSSKFTDTEATKFVADWKVVAQIPNTTTGFSGTLFQSRSNPNEYVISFRSTEFIDDAARDCESTNKEIKDYGFAFGQLADMETWYQTSIKNLIPAGAKVDVTGYSLGGHLATAFNLMHGAELNGGQVITFNGAGIGEIGDGSLADTRAKLTQMVQSFQALMEQDTLESHFTTNDGKQDYNALRAAIAAKNGQPDDDLLTQFSYLKETAIAELKLLYEALEATVRIAKEALRVPKLTSGPDANGVVTSPDNVKAPEIAGCSLDYQLAVLFTARQYGTQALPLIDGAQNIWFGKDMGEGSPLTNQHDLVGTETTSRPTAMVSNSQYHYGQHDSVFIEDQPLYRGTAPTDIIASGLQLLVDAYSQNDFGDDAWRLAA
jgi:hypothetical protein